jgi:predicted nucleic acid-binding protein
VSHFYLDASAVVKRYSPETGTAWVKALTEPATGHTIILGEITRAEVAAAVAAKHRAPGGITIEERDDAVALFLSHCITDYDLIAVNRSIIERAVDLTLKHKLRGYDAVQLATALVANEALSAADLAPLIFVAADADLVAAAGAEGLPTGKP